MEQKVRYIHLGNIDYGRCWEHQRKLFDRLVAGDRDAIPTLLLCEHPHVYTLGKSGHEDNLLVNDQFLKKIGATYYRIDRGGDITYHGPGQMVGYPILELTRLGIGLREYIHKIEQAVIDTLAAYDITAGRSEGAAGVWLEQTARSPLRKICAIGVRSSRFVTMHGFALNVSTQMEYFSYINPCGFTDRGVTSIEQELGRKVDMNEVARIFCDNFSRIFEVELTR